MKSEMSRIQIFVHGEWPKISGEVTADNKESATALLQPIKDACPVFWIGSALQAAKGRVIVPFRGDKEYGAFVHDPEEKGK